MIARAFRPGAGSLILMLLTAAAMAWAWYQPALNNPLERAWYQLLMPTHTSSVTQNIIRIELDDARPREQLIRLLREISRHHPAAVGLDLNLSAPIEDVSANKRWDGIRDLSSVVARKMPKTAAGIRRLAAEGKWLSDVDARLSQAIHATAGIYLGFRSQSASGKSSPLPEAAIKPRLLNAQIQGNGKPRSRRIHALPLTRFIEEASGVGDTSIVDLDPLAPRILTATEKRWLPSLALLLAVKQAQGHTQSIRIDGRKIRYGDLSLPLDRDGRLLIGFSSAFGSSEPYPLMQASEVIQGKTAWREFANKIILIGEPERAIWPTPVGTLSDREMMAQTITAILDQHYYRLHPQAAWIQIVLLLVIAGVLLLLLARMPLWLAWVSMPVMAAALIGVDAWLLLVRHVWLPAAIPLLFLLLAFSSLLILRLFRDQKLRALRESADIRRDLGLLHQQSGNLDKALSVFRKLPSDPDSMELLYSLGKEFERKRRFHQAAAAYEWIVARNPDFRDALKRCDKAHQLEAAGVSGSGSVTSSLLIDGMDHKPTLGRYEIEKMIGKGAMGEVYLGRDPSIDRIVAIKTLPLTSEFSPEEIEEVRERFFHEAAAAGRLNHSNIVTIYDVGEEHDLAFMAMEYIDGYSLDEHAAADTLLPIDKVIGYIIQTARALDYAHGEGIVHRDVKPANLMIDRRKDQVKITDFGIARITSHSRTKTGMLLGTPSYMSPEQAMGHRVDHRADIFSLGSTMYVLLTGDKPFSGDSLASLFYNIINKPHPDIRKLNPKVSDSLKRIIDKAMQKDPDKRYQSAGALARALSRLKIQA